MGFGVGAHRSLQAVAAPPAEVEMIEIQHTSAAQPHPTDSVQTDSSSDRQSIAPFMLDSTENSSNIQSSFEESKQEEVK
jgi:hypothetical protein